jgi:hypothetical protein
MSQQLEAVEPGGAGGGQGTRGPPAANLACIGRGRRLARRLERARTDPAAHRRKPPRPPAPPDPVRAAAAGAGTEFVGWLADARRSLVVGMEEFIGRDIDRLTDLDPARLLSLLGRVDVFELLGQHHARWAGGGSLAGDGAMAGPAARRTGRGGGRRRVGGPQRGQRLLPRRPGAAPGPPPPSRSIHPSPP